MPKIAEETRAARRDQIIAAALACFARAGYHATTMADVAAQAGVSKGTPYLYFESKEALFIALHEEWDCGLADRVNAAIAALPEAGRRSPRQVLQAVAAAVAAHVLAETETCRADGPVAPGARLIFLAGRRGRARRRPGTTGG
jgi:AcrR family transcriptional regulator